MTQERDPGDAVPPGVAPQTPAPLSENDKLIQKKLEQIGDDDQARKPGTAAPQA